MGWWSVATACWKMPSGVCSSTAARRYGIRCSPSAPLLEPRRQRATLGRLRHGPEYEVVVPQDRDLVRDEQPPPPLELRLPPPTPPPVLSLPVPDPGQEVRMPLPEESSAFSEEEEASTGSAVQAVLPVEPPGSPVEPPLSLERSQRSWQPAPYL